MIQHQEYDSIKMLLQDNYEVNQSLGLAMLKSQGLPENRLFWNSLMTDSCLKLKWCVEYDLAEEVALVKLKKVAASESKQLKILEQFPNLEHLYLLNSLYILYYWVIDWSKFPNLKTLHLVNSSIADWPMLLEFLTELESLSLAENTLLKLNANIGRFSKLKELYLAQNRLKSLPVQIGALQQLRVLDLRKNYLKTVEEVLLQLTNLEELHLANNELQILPKNIDNLRSLKVLNLKGNKIKALPDSFEKLSSLEKVIIKGTPLAQNRHLLSEWRAAMPQVQWE